MILWRKCWAVAKKDIWVYYKKGPVLIFGILFPVFLFLAFAIGRDMPPDRLAPGLIGMALFFTASATTPTVFPFETRTGTLERLLAAPLDMKTLLMGDILAAFLFGMGLSAVPDSSRASPPYSSSRQSMPRDAAFSEKSASNRLRASC